MCDVQTGVVACVVIPPVQGFALGDWDATKRAMTAGVRLEFAQPWLPQPEAGYAPGHVWLGVHGDELIVYGVLEDDQPANSTTQWNEPTWSRGDVLEFFFQPDQRDGYHEFHVTPENQRLQLIFPTNGSFREKRGHRHWAVAESLFESATRVNDTRTGWEAVMRIKLARVLDLPRDDGSRRFRYSFSRYDYLPGRERPITSATTALSAPDFHKVAEWSWAEVARV
jgi:hypothetical protein